MKTCFFQYNLKTKDVFLTKANICHRISDKRYISWEPSNSRLHAVRLSLTVVRPSARLSLVSVKVSLVTSSLFLFSLVIPEHERQEKDERKQAKSKKKKKTYRRALSFFVFFLVFSSLFWPFLVFAVFGPCVPIICFH